MCLSSLIVEYDVACKVFEQARKHQHHPVLRNVYKAYKFMIIGIDEEDKLVFRSPLCGKQRYYIGEIYHSADDGPANKILDTKAHIDAYAQQNGYCRYGSLEVFYKAGFHSYVLPDKTAKRISNAKTPMRSQHSGTVFVEVETGGYQQFGFQYVPSLTNKAKFEYIPTVVSGLIVIKNVIAVTSLFQHCNRDFIEKVTPLLKAINPKLMIPKI